MVRFINSKSGLPAAFVNGIYLNSRYDPKKEAYDLVRKKLGDTAPKTAIILGETLGYLSEALYTCAPETRCIQVFYDPALFEKCRFNTPDVWHPEKNRTLYEFIQDRMCELDIQDLSIIEWPPSAKAYPKVSENIQLSLRRAIGIFNGNIATTARFGRLWLKNTVRNYLSVETVSANLPESQITVVAASGPSLSESMKWLRDNRAYFFLIALPSAMRALVDGKVIPDLLVITDPGYYSGLHLTPAYQGSYPVAMPYTSVKEASRNAAQVVLLNQGTYLENAIIAKSEIPHLMIRQNGTVAGTALDIARLIAPTVVFAGLDLTGRDVQSHVRPHAFDPILDFSAARTEPALTTRYLRTFHNLLNSAKGTKIDAFGTYAGWFNAIAPGITTDLYRLHESPVYIRGIKPLDGAEFSSLCKAQRPVDTGNTDLRRRPSVQAPPADRKRYIIKSVLKEAKEAVAVQADQKLSAYTGSTVYSMIYYASTGTLLKALCKNNEKLFTEAADETISFIDELNNIVDSWAI